jgi:glycosyltransferase involved in cell wall biosynthesis
VPVKKRVLVVGEASFRATGFSTYQDNLMRRMLASGKYELAELSSYAEPADPRVASLPWKFYPSYFDRNVPGEEAEYHARPTNQFGEWKFEGALLDFRPDVVVSFRDPWMDAFIAHSPLRPHYRWLWMPTVDAEPQDNDWLSLLTQADAVFTYSDWGLESLRRQVGVPLNLLGSAPPCFDHDCFTPCKDRLGYRESLGIQKDTLVVGFVARNQCRKLFPDLLRAFARFNESAPADLARKTFLYLHTAWPDVGWDIPRLLKETGMGHKALFTYLCRACGGTFPAFYADSRLVCRLCGKPAAMFPTDTNGVSREALRGVYWLMDAYVQYSVCEGFGMPMVEAAACGAPVFAVDYSAMSDVSRKLAGFQVPVQRYFRDPTTHRWLALPDDGAFVAMLTDFLLKPAPVRVRFAGEAAAAAAANYSWDETAAKWMAAADAAPPALPWSSPPRLHDIPDEIPEGLSDPDFVRWGISEVAGTPELAHSWMASRLSRDLFWGQAQVGQGGGGILYNESSTLGSMRKLEHFNRRLAYDQFRQMGEKKNYWEARRAQVTR